MRISRNQSWEFVHAALVFSRYRRRKSAQGQILIEALIAIAILAVVAGLGTQLVTISMQSIASSKTRGASMRMAQEGIEAVRAIAYGNDNQSQGWNKIYRPPDGTGDPVSSKQGIVYHPVLGGTPPRWSLMSGIESVTVDGEMYERSIMIENVSRDTLGAIESSYTPANDDPSTQNIIVRVTKQNAPETEIAVYLTRFFNETSRQSDWMGPANCGPVSATSSSNSFCFLACIRRNPGIVELRPGC